MTRRAPLLSVLLATVLSLAGIAVGIPRGWLPGTFRADYLATHSHSTVASQGAVEPTVPKARCGAGSRPEGRTQGRVPRSDYQAGRAGLGYSCNAVEVAHVGTTGGYKTFRYTDPHGHKCAYYDGSLLFGSSAVHQSVGGTHVLDVSDDRHPLETATLLTPAMQSPHESLALSSTRGLLAAGMGNAATAPGFVDIYDVATDCRYPRLLSSTPLGLFGHEGSFSPDGRMLWISGVAFGLNALDVSDPALPALIWRNHSYNVHGMSFNSAGTRLYGADLGLPGLTILDVSRVRPGVFNPAVSEVSRTSWPGVALPQSTMPVTIRGHAYLLEFDEFARNAGSVTNVDYQTTATVGVARLLDIGDERHPRVASEMRLEVNRTSARAGDQRNDPGAEESLQGYAAHYCAVPRTVDPGILACSYILSGLRVFNITDPKHPREVAYFNKPAPDNGIPLLSGSYSMSAPSFDPRRQQVYFSDANSGFYTVRLTNGSWPSGRTAHR